MRLDYKNPNISAGISMVDAFAYSDRWSIISYDVKMTLQGRKHTVYIYQDVNNGKYVKINELTDSELIVDEISIFHFDYKAFEEKTIVVSKRKEVTPRVINWSKKDKKKTEKIKQLSPLLRTRRERHRAYYLSLQTGEKGLRPMYPKTKASIEFQFRDNKSLN